MPNFEEKVEISIRGKDYTLTREMVVEAAKRLKDEGHVSHRNSKYHVIVVETRFTTPSLLAESLGLMLIEVQGQQAFRALTELGFTVVDSQREKRREKSKEARKA